MATMKIAVIGAAGRIGKALIKNILNKENIQLSYAVDSSSSKYINQDVSIVINAKTNLGIKITDNIENAIQNSDIAIDFTNPLTSKKVITTAVTYNKPIVIGTTGFSEADFQYLQTSASEIKILYSSNMSTGVNILLVLANQLSSALKEDNWDISLCDIHHKHKLDSPSGTAKALQKEIKKANPTALVNTVALRVGEVIGEHTLTWYGPGEKIEIKHTAQDRNIFALGALKAAIWLYNNKATAGLFSIRDMLDFSY